VNDAAALMLTLDPEREGLRALLRKGRKLPAIAVEIGTTAATLEVFLTAGAGITPHLRAAVARLLARSVARMAVPAPAPAPATPSTRNGMKLNARSLKCTVVLDPAELVEPAGNASRINLQIAVGSKSFTADVATKSIRKARATIVEHGVDQVALVLQGRLDGTAIVEAGLVA
jgi:hypothetical protein